LNLPAVYQKMFARINVSVIDGGIRYMSKPIRGENAEALLQSAEMQAIIAPYVARVSKIGFYPDMLYLHDRVLNITCEHDKIDVLDVRILISDTEIIIEIKSALLRKLNWYEFTTQHYTTKKFLKKTARAKSEIAALRAENTALRLLPGAPDYLAAQAHFEQLAAE